MVVCKRSARRETIVVMDEPQPGRPGSLRGEEDLADAAALFEVVKASYATLQRRRPRAGPLRLVREAVWFLWEQPRLPRPLIASKYPLDYPWSPTAQDIFKHFYQLGSRRPGGWGLVIEHLYPRELLVRDLIMLAVERFPGDDVEPQRVVQLLTSRLMAAIVGRGEDRQLLARRKSPDTWTPYESDPWLRYRSTALEPSKFKVLDEDLRWEARNFMGRY